MKKYYWLMVVIGIQVGLFGCSTQTTSVQNVQKADDTQRLIIVSSGDPSAVLPAFESYTWSDDYNRVLSAVAGHDDHELKGYIREQIQVYLSTKGYKYQPDPQKADVVIGFLFALEDAIADKTIQQRFGLLPGLKRETVNDPRYEKGSLLLAVLDNQEKTIYWRSAVQGFVDLQEDKVNSERMQGILSMMLGEFPPAGH